VERPLAAALTLALTKSWGTRDTRDVTSGPVYITTGSAESGAGLARARSRVRTRMHYVERLSPFPSCKCYMCTFFVRRPGSGEASERRRESCAAAASVELCRRNFLLALNLPRSAPLRGDRLTRNARNRQNTISQSARGTRRGSRVRNDIIARKLL